MGRKIPAKKHRGVKDPLAQQAKRLQSLKGKINAPPKDPDEQPVPQSLKQLFAFQNKDKVTKRQKKNKKNLRDIVRDSRGGENPIAQLKKLPGESGRGFSLRINSALKALHDPTEQLDYPQDLDEDDDEKGERMAAQRERRQRKRKAAAKSGAADVEPKLTRTQKFALKKQAKKLKAEEASRPELRYERVQFGERADAPPALVAPRRAPPRERAGGRDLLLTAMLAGAGAGGASAGGAGERERERRERARLDAVAAYRALKKQRRLAAAAPGKGDRT